MLLSRPLSDMTRLSATDAGGNSMFATMGVAGADREAAGLGRVPMKYTWLSELRIIEKVSPQHRD